MEKIETEHKFIEYEEPSTKTNRRVIKLFFRNSGHYIQFNLSKGKLNKLYKYINGELSVKDNSHITFAAPSFKIMNIDTEDVYLVGKDFQLVLNSLYDGELKLTAMGAMRGSSTPTIIGTIRIVYDDDSDYSEKML